MSIMGMSIPKLIGVAFIATAMVNWRRYFGKSPPAVTMYLLVVIIGIISDIVQLNYCDMTMANEIARPILVFITFFVAYNLGLNGQNERMIKTLAGSSAVFALLSVLGFGQDMGYVSEIGRDIVKIAGEEFERATTFGTNPNGAARLIALSFLFSVLVFFGIMPCKMNFYRWLWMGVGGGTLVAIIQTASRGGVAGLVAGVMSIMFTTRKTGEKLIVVTIVALAMGLLAFSVARDELFRHRIKSESQDRTLGGRVVLWTASMECFKDAPVFGQGHFFHAYNIGAKVGKEQRSAHNTFLGILVGTGFIGFTFYVLFWLFTLRCAWKIRVDRSGIGKVLFVWISMGLVSALMMSMQMSKWLMVLMAMILSQYKILLYEQQQRRMLEHVE